MATMAVLAQAAVGSLTGTFGTKAADQLIVFLLALIAAVGLTLPALALVAWLDRRERESPCLYAFAITRGMLGAVGPSLLLNGAAIHSVTGLLAPTESGAPVAATPEGHGRARAPEAAGVPVEA